jgi:hypothetical protein
MVAFALSAGEQQGPKMNTLRNGQPLPKQFARHRFRRLRESTKRVKRCSTNEM